MSFRSWPGDAEPIRPVPVAPAEGEHERRNARSSRLGTGTLACPACDAPVSPTREGHTPRDRLDCPFCTHTAPARDFLSLSAPARPARVAIRVTHRTAHAT